LSQERYSSLTVPFRFLSDFRGGGSAVLAAAEAGFAFAPTLGRFALEFPALRPDWLACRLPLVPRAVRPYPLLVCRCTTGYDGHKTNPRRSRSRMLCCCRRTCHWSLGSSRHAIPSCQRSSTYILDVVLGRRLVVGLERLRSWVWIACGCLGPVPKVELVYIIAESIECQTNWAS
jgi:hypothetical protein